MGSPPTKPRLADPQPSPTDVALAETRPHPQGDGAPAPSPAATEDRDPLIGQKVRAYRIVRELGRGGMGVVYEAVHEEIGQRAAVKTLNLQRLPGGKADPAVAQRFLTEARAIAIAQHPGLVQVFDYGQLDDGTLFLLMEFLDGQSLASRLERRAAAQAGPGSQSTLPLLDAVRIGRQIATALLAAHEKGIVHRDLKPSNVYIVRDAESPSGERMKILDFGLARIVGDTGPQGGSAGAAMRTSTGVVMGTPIYMAPEQCRGLAQANAQADVYSLGVILYELLAGTPPFTGNTSGDLIAMHIFRKPPPLARRVRGLPTVLTHLVMRMLLKEPEARPPMREVAETLRALEAGDTLQQRARTSAPPQVGVAIGAVLLAGAGLYWAHPWGRHETPLRAPAIEPASQNTPAAVVITPTTGPGVGAGSSGLDLGAAAGAERPPGATPEAGGIEIAKTELEHPAGKPIAKPGTKNMGKQKPSSAGNATRAAAGATREPSAGPSPAPPPTPAPAQTPTATDEVHVPALR